MQQQVLNALSLGTNTDNVEFEYNLSTCEIAEVQHFCLSRRYFSAFCSLGWINICAVLFLIFIVYCTRRLHSCSRICIIIASSVLTVYCLTRETLHTLRGKETTHMNSRIIITAGLDVPLPTGPSTISFDAWLLFYITSNWYIINILTTYSHVCTYTFCCVYLIKINQWITHQSIFMRQAAVGRCHCAHYGRIPIRLCMHCVSNGNKKRSRCNPIVRIFCSLHLAWIMTTVSLIRVSRHECIVATVRRWDDIVQPNIYTTETTHESVWLLAVCECAELCDARESVAMLWGCSYDHSLPQAAFQTRLVEKQTGHNFQPFHWNKTLWSV